MEMNYNEHKGVDCIYQKENKIIIEHIILVIRNCVMLSFEDG